MQVDFAPLEEDVHLRRAAAASGLASGTARAPTVQPTTSGRGAAFQAALSSVTGHSVVPTLPSELTSLPQAEKVRRLAREIHSLFQRFDSGQLPLDHFRESLHGLGVEETEESKRLLRQTPLNFSEFFRALTHTDPPSAAAAGVVSGGATSPSRSAPGLHAAGSGTPLGGRRLGPRPSEQGGADVLTWSTGPTHGDVPAYTTGKYDNRHIQETGAGAIIFNKEGGVEEGADVLDWHRSGYTKGTDASLPGESGVGASLWGETKGVGYAGERDHPDDRFESVSQATARAGLGGDIASARPATSAGYLTRDGGMLREQVYSIIRQLDRGTINTRTFKSQLERLGVQVPPPVNKLLLKYSSHGTATFAQFVRAFEDYFAAQAHSEPVPLEPASEARPTTAPEQTGKGAGVYISRKGLAKTAALHAGHGDILTWQGDISSSPADDIRAARLAGHRPGMARRRHLYDNSHGIRDIITWEGDEGARGQLSTATGMGGRATRRATSASAQRNAGNFIQWAGGHGISDAPSDAQGGIAGVTESAPGYDGGRSRGGDVLPSGIRSGRGRALPTTSIAIKERFGTDAPFGTSQDETPGTHASQHPPTRANPNFHGGEWLTDAHAQKAVYANRPAQPAPAYTSAPYRHQYSMQYQEADHDVQRQVDGTYQ